MINRDKAQLSGWLLCGLMCCAWLPMAVAQNGEDAEDDQPPPETEIVCFAAKKQWVCAPADDKEKAHQKAMRLAEQPDQAESFRDGQVAIQTMPDNNNFAQQVQEVDPNSLQGQIRDFVAREEADSKANTKTDTANPDNQPAPSESINNDTAVVTASAAAAEPEPAVTEPVVTEVTMAQTDTRPTVTRDDMVADQPSKTGRPQNRSSQHAATVANDFDVWQRNHPRQWAFQVVGTSNRHHIDDFVRTSGIESMPHAVVKTQVNGADWWVVLVGLFDSREQALDQRHTLPATLASNAWVRQIQSIVGQAD